MTEKGDRGRRAKMTGEEGQRKPRQNDRKEGTAEGALK